MNSTSTTMNLGEDISDDEKQKLSSMIQQLETRDSLRFYNFLVQRCFADCVQSFTLKNLNKPEETCVRQCAVKYWKHTMRTGQRFSEVAQDPKTMN